MLWGKFERLRETYKFVVVVFLLAIACSLLYYFHVVLEKETIASHFFYIPIILACIWWKRKGLIVAVFSFACLILIHIFLELGIGLYDEFIRGVMFIAIGLVVTVLSEHTTRAEKTLQGSEEIYRTLVENISLGITLIDTNYRIIMTNTSQGRLLRKPQSEFIGKYCFREFEKRDAVCSHCPGTRAMATGRPAEVETEGVRDDGSRVPARIHAFPVYEADGTVKGFIEVVEDITERKKAEEELKAFEERFSSLAERSFDIIFMTDAQGYLTYISAASERIFHYKPEEMVGTHFKNYLIKSEIPRVSQRFAENMQGRNLGILPMEAMRKDGSHVFVELNSSPILKDDETVGIQGIMRDITERKKTEEALHKERDRAERYLNIAGVMLLVVDADETVTLINRRGCEVLGYSEDEIVGRNWFDTFIAEPIREEVRGVFKKLVAGELEPVEYYENPVITNSGEERLIAWRNTVLKDEQGNIIGTLSSAEDITEHKKAEDALRESETQHRTLISNIPGAVYRAACIPERWTIYFFSDAIQEITGYPVSDFIEDKVRTYASIIHPEDGKMVDEIVLDCVSKHIPYSLEYRVICADGSLRWIHDKGQGIFNKNGEVSWLDGVVFDITERKQAEEALKESQERYKALFEGIAEGILVADIETKRFKYANPAICRMLGYTEEELKRLSVRDIHPKEDLEYVIAEFEAQTRGEKTLSPNIPCLRKGGTVIYAAVNSANVLIDGVECSVGMFTDITKRKQTEEELLFKTTLLEAQSETSIDGILVVDGKGKSLLFNKRFGQMWNIPQHILNTRDDEKMLQCALSQLKDPDKFLERVKYLYAHKDEKSRDEILFKDGRVFDRYSSPLRDSTGKHYGRIWYFRDITQRKRTEQELEKARDELEIRVRERTTELENAVKKLRSEISERKKAEEKLLTYQKQLRSSASELSLAEERLRRKIATDVHDHISQNLAISKLKIESLTQSTTSPELARELEEIRDLIAQVVESTRSLTFELSPPVLYELGFEAAVEWLVRQTRKQYGLSAEFEGDGRTKPLDGNVRILLFQAVRELLVNVVKHAKASSVKVSTQRVGDQIRVSVEDDGVGFDVTQVHSQDHMTGGFGLFNIRERLDHIGGHLDIASRAGKGTRITLVAPITHEKEKSKGKQK